MADTFIPDTGVAMTDITSYREQLAATRAQLAAIYAGFDPARPELLFAREAEIVDLANNTERLREIVERLEAAEERRTNILAVWELVKALPGGAA